MLILITFDGGISYSANMYFRFLLCICLTIQMIHAKTEEEIRTWFVGQAMECNKEHPVTPEELTMLHKHKLPDTKNAKCLLACVFRKAKFLDDKGMFDLAAAQAQCETTHEGDDKKIENSKKLMEMCQAVNSQEVSDGEAGCDRALLLLKCFKDNGPGLGFPIMTIE